MKITLFNTLLLAGIISLAACNNSSRPVQQVTSKGGESYNDTVSRVLYPLGAAQQDAATFDSLSRLYLKDTTAPIRAYTIRAVDLLAALGMPGQLADSSICQYKYIRVYLGYRIGIGFKLFIVPVQGADLTNMQGGVDLLLDSAGTAIQPGQKVVGPQYVLDLNAPCPNTCATNSPFGNQ